MSNSKPLRVRLDGRPVFFQEFLRHPLQIGSIISSSRFLEHRIVEAAGISSAKTIVELGPGTGGTTRAILRVMAQHANLLSIEINPHLHTLVSRIEDERLIAHCGDAHRLKEIINFYGLCPPEVIISGIPFSTMSHISGSQIIEAISSVLPQSGRFVAYQVSKRVVSLCQPLLGLGQAEVEILNIPPMRVYRWEKKDV
ncbi:MAG: methyltransferase type 12 [Thermodesulfobacteriota bacterium]|nr:methyltransferase type 12 [Thermodesulfobacteriota bacterium]